MNGHRLADVDMRLLLDRGLRLTHFDESRAVGGDPALAAPQGRAHRFLNMEWAGPDQGSALLARLAGHGVFGQSSSLLKARSS